MAPSEDPPHRRRDGAIALAIGALALAAVLIGQSAPPSGPAAPTLPAEDMACAEWSNGCRVCVRRGEGTACSLPGIACTPGASACMRRAP